MGFYADDIYTSSGSTFLQNAWTPYVSKFDTSTFYNWEQDNLPLYDLEERTYELWEQAGYPTSSVPGLALVVSGDAPAATLAANPNIFTTVSACIAAIPKVVRFPVLIEVCNFGDLGKLELHNFRIEEGGSIEIINRTGIKIYAASSYAAEDVDSPTNNASIRMLSAFSSIDTTLYVANASSLINQSKVFSSSDVRVNIDPNSFLYPISTTRRGNLAFSEDLTTTSLVANAFSRNPYENVSTDDETSLLYDISAASQYDTSRETYRTYPVNLTDTVLVSGDRVTGLLYFSHFKTISVKNCDGPIYIRNFIVDGERTATTGQKVGIEIINSDVVLENCGAVKCLDAGFRFNNSKVVLSRSAFSYRNYDISSTTDRIPNTGIGFEFINSEVTLSANIESGNGNYDRDASGYDVVFCASRNDKGFVLENSVLKGGFARQVVSDEDTQGSLVSELNTSYGIELNNSKVDLDGLIDIYANDVGIKSYNSFINFYNLCAESNNTKGIDAYNSVITFDSKDRTLSTKGEGQTSRHQLDFRENGQHLHLHKNSNMSFKRTDHMPSKFGGSLFLSAHGVVTWDGSGRANLPAISVEDSSHAEFIHAVIKAKPDSEILTNPGYGLAAQAIKNSSIEFYGTGSGCTFILGENTTSPAFSHAALYASDNSKIEIHGPTMIGQVAIPILAEDNSTIDISPPKKAYGLLDVSGFDLQNTQNHTSVELHAARSCLVANENSKINIKDLGHYSKFWNTTTLGQNILASGVDFGEGDSFNTSAYISNGSLQFYPNPFNDGELPNFSLEDNITGLTDSIVQFPIFTSGSNQNYLLAGPYDNPQYNIVSSICLGGMCLRAVGDSLVNVRNVHFPKGTNNTALDGIYYNASGLTCDRLMIWNIADNSKLRASYLSVSGGYPSEAGYHGPSSVWVSGATEIVASGAPSSTPDTGILSVLDQFGAGPSYNCWTIPFWTNYNDPFDQIDFNKIESNLAGALPYGLPPFEWANQGVFRLYFSVDPAAKLLQIDLNGGTQGGWPHAGSFSGIAGVADQVFAQGYNCSAALSAIETGGSIALSSLYPQLLKYYAAKSGGGADGKLLDTVGFYWCQEFVENNPTQCILDESAGNTFANSKNASTGLSGKPKKVTIQLAGRGDISTDSETAVNRASESYAGDYGITQFRSQNIFDLEREV